MGYLCFAPTIKMSQDIDFEDHVLEWSSNKTARPSPAPGRNVAGSDSGLNNNKKALAWPQQDNDVAYPGPVSSSTSKDLRLD